MEYMYYFSYSISWLWHIFLPRQDERATRRINENGMRTKKGSLCTSSHRSGGSYVSGLQYARNDDKATLSIPDHASSGIFRKRCDKTHSGVFFHNGRSFWVLGGRSYDQSPAVSGNQVDV